MINLKEAVFQRKSVRSFDGNLLSEDHKSLVVNYIRQEQNKFGPFGNKVGITFQEEDQLRPKEKIGTYGFIKNAPIYLIGICKNDTESLLDMGFAFEKIVLYLQTQGIGSCWVGGTFNRKKLKLKHAMKQDEFIPVISPIGYQASKMHFVDKVVRKMAKSDNRMNFDQLFFYQDFTAKIDSDSVREMLEYVRVAPSASNKQPWRIVMDQNGDAHFFIERTPKYGHALGYDIQMIDMGIALFHYVLASGKDHVFQKEIWMDMPNENTSYLFSVK